MYLWFLVGYIFHLRNIRITNSWLSTSYMLAVYVLVINLLWSSHPICSHISIDTNFRGQPFTQDVNHVTRRWHLDLHEHIMLHTHSLVYNGHVYTHTVILISTGHWVLRPLRVGWCIVGQKYMFILSILFIKKNTCKDDTHLLAKNILLYTYSIILSMTN